MSLLNFNWVAKAEELSDAALTVAVQTDPDLNTDDKLMQDTLMPREDVDSVKLTELGALSFRPAADRRAWDQRGRQIPLRIPGKTEIEIEPIESYFSLAEREMQALRERFLSNEQLIVDQIKAEIAGTDTKPGRIISLAEANYCRIELDVFESWIMGVITVRDPQTGETYPVSYGFDPARYEPAGTAWDQTGINAYNEFISWLGDAIQMVGSISGVAMTTPVRRLILKSAPQLTGGVVMSLANLSDRISQDIQKPFQFYMMDDLPTIDVFPDGGTDTVATSRWPDASKIALVPQDQKVGTVKYAPVGRAMDLAAALPQAKIDIRGMSVFLETANNGKALTGECQANVVPLPNEKRIAVFDTGITA